MRSVSSRVRSERKAMAIRHGTSRSNKTNRACGVPDRLKGGELKGTGIISRRVATSPPTEKAAGIHPKRRALPKMIPVPFNSLL
jgi:hypothetical protein